MARKTFNTGDIPSAADFNSLAQNAELADVVDQTKGSALIGHVSSGVGAVRRSAQSKLRESVSLKDFGAIGDGITDDTAAMQAAIDATAAGATIYGDAASVFKFTNLEVTKSLTLDFAGAQLIANPSSVSKPAIWFHGASGTDRPISAAARGDTQVALTNPADYAEFGAGVWVVVADATVTAPLDAAGTSFGARQELRRVISIAAGVAQLDSGLEQAYSTTPTMRKVTLLSAPVVRNIGTITEVTPASSWSGALSGAVPHLIHFQRCIQPYVENIRATAWQVHAVNAHECIDPIVRRSSFFEPIDVNAGRGYACRFDRCANGLFDSNLGVKVRHLLDHVMTFGPRSQNNVSYQAAQPAFCGHGHGSRGYISSADQSYGDSAGWAMGNSTFNADYDFTLISPRYIGPAQAVIFTTGSTNLTIRSPYFKTPSRAVAVTCGARGVIVDGGEFDHTGATDTTTASIYVYPYIASGAATAISAGDVRLTGGLKIRFPDNIGRAVHAIDPVGCVRYNGVEVYGSEYLYADGGTLAPELLEIDGLDSYGVTKFGVLPTINPSLAMTVTRMTVRNYSNTGLQIPAGNAARVFQCNIRPGTGGGSLNNAYKITDGLDTLMSSGGYFYGNAGAGTQVNAPANYGSFTRPLRVCGMYLWADPATAKLYIKNAAPTTVTDGTVVGTQV